MEEENKNASAPELSLKKWYIVTTYSMHEAKTADNLKKRIKSMGMENKIFRVLIGEKEEPVLKDGIPTGKMRKINQYPGYIYIEMIMTDQSWYIVRNTPGVTGIVGSKGGGQKPTPVPQLEMESVLKRMGLVDPTMYERYHIGDKVKVIHGPLEGTEGEILSIDKETGACRVNTTFFGRSTPIDVEFAEIEKI